MKTPYQHLISLFLTTLVLTGCLGPESPQEVTQKFWESVISHDVDDAIEYSTLVDAKSYDAFNKKWDGYQSVTGQIVINGNQAEVETELSQINETGKNQQKLNTFLVKQDGQWKVDYVRTAESINGGGTLSHFLGQLNGLGKKLSDTIKVSSDKFRVEMQRFEDELKTLAKSSSDEANKIIEQYGTELKDSIEELAESIDRALKEHDENLSEDEKQTLIKVSADLEKNQQTLSEPTISNISESSRHLNQLQQQLNDISNEKITGYKKQWHNWQYSFESDMQSLLNTLSEKQKN